MKLSKLLLDGRSKRLYEAGKDIIMEFKANEENEKGYNSLICAELFRRIEDFGIETHFIKLEKPGFMRVKRLEMLPIEIMIRNYAAGGLCKRLGLRPGQLLGEPIIEYYLKSRERGYPMVNRSHLASLGLVSEKTLEKVEEIALGVNIALIDRFDEVNITLADLKIEIGQTKSDHLLVADEISPRTALLWESGKGYLEDEARKPLKSEEVYKKLYD
jgi:phosphoribosylaminoimidazole-succinocarboxamide synthase